jgi:hypothetical protein
MTRATKLMGHVREFFDSIIMPVEPLLKAHKTEYGKYMLRRSSFSPEAAAQMKKKLRTLDAASIPHDTKQMHEDPTIPTQQRLIVLMLAAHSARRGDKFVELPLLRWAGVDPEVIKALQKVYKSANRPKNSMMEKLNDMFKPQVYPQYKMSLALVHRFFEDHKRFEEHIVFPLEPMIGEAQKSALMHAVNIVGCDDTDVDLGNVHICKCDNILTPVVESSNAKGIKICAGGVLNAKYDVANRHMHCNRGKIAECYESAIKINLLGKILSIRDHQYALCIYCGVLTTVSIDRWTIGPHCGQHTSQVPPNIYKDTMPRTEVHRLPSYQLYMETLRANTPPPPNRGIITKCAFCNMVTSKDIGSVSLVVYDDTKELDPPGFKPVHVCNNCNYYVRLITREHSTTLKLTIIRRLLVDMISMPQK